MKINKKNLILLIALVVIIIALVAISSLNKKTINTGSQTNLTTKNQNTAAKSDQVNKAGQAVDINSQNASGTVTGAGTAAPLATIPGGASASGTPAVNQNFAPVNPTVTSQNPAVIASLSSMPGTNEAPKQVVVAADKIPAAAIKLSVSDSGFSPKEFTIKSGQEVSLAITAVGSSTHVFIFPIASLMGLQTMVSNEETKVITFTAPDPGRYGFRDDIPSFRMNTGTMIVK